MNIDHILGLFLQLRLQNLEHIFGSFTSEESWPNIRIVVVNIVLGELDSPEWLSLGIHHDDHDVVELLLVEYGVFLLLSVEDGGLDRVVDELVDILRVEEAVEDTLEPDIQIRINVLELVLVTDQELVPLHLHL